MAPFDVRWFISFTYLNFSGAISSLITVNELLVTSGNLTVKANSLYLGGSPQMFARRFIFLGLHLHPHLIHLIIYFQPLI